jgi:uncharacterized membrane protein required for colicin V production
VLILAIDIAVIGIVVFCGWRGYRNGLIRGVFGVVALIVSLFIASTAATAYSGEFKEILSPFVGGIVDTALTATPEEGEESEEPDLEGFEEKSDDFIIAYSALRRIGLFGSPAAYIADQATEDGEDAETAEEETPEESKPAFSLSELIAEKLSSTLSYAAVFGIAFILLAIIFTVIGNLIGFVFSLPGLRLLDIIAGAAFGLAKGLIIIFALAAVLRYAGLISPATINGTHILKSIVNNNPIARAIGI